MGVTYDTGALVAADRGERRQRARHRALLARATGALAARSATTDIVDACVVEGALRRHDLIISSDPGDLHAIAAAISRHLEIDHP
jgi:hypothetical protein